MKIHSLIIVSELAICLAVPAMAQQSMHRYVGFFKYSDTAVKAMTENPQDRSAQSAKLWESFGGKQESIYFFPSGSEYDGMVIAGMGSVPYLSGVGVQRTYASSRMTRMTQSGPQGKKQQGTGIVDRTTEIGTVSVGDLKRPSMESLESKQMIGQINLISRTEH